VSQRRSKHAPRKSGRLLDTSPDDQTAELQARTKVKRLWQLGDLFHVSTRYPRRPDAPRIDRLAGILKRGLVAPAHCRDGLVRSELHLMVTGCSVPYNSLVFLHRFIDLSYIYTLCEPGRFSVFLEPTIPVLTPDAMGPHWVELCQDEVYVRDCVGPEKMIGVAVHPADADSVLQEFLGDFQRLQIPLYDYDGNVLWPLWG
jgi:hypothetical protein